MKIGLTGSIASGKSTVSDYIKSKGIPIIDADKISKEICNIGEIGYNKIKENFGNKFFNQDFSLNRKKLGEYIFNDKNQKLKLEKLLHPIIRQKMFKEYDTYISNGFKYVIFDIPLLFESRLENIFDCIWLVHTSYENQIFRLKKRNGYDECYSKKIISNQMSSEEKFKLANVIIYNNSDLTDLHKQIDKLLYEMESK